MTCPICKKEPIPQPGTIPAPHPIICDECLAPLACTDTQPYPTSSRSSQTPHTNPPSEAIRHDQDKPDWSLVPMHHLEGMVRVLEFGKKKYAAHNWRKGLHYSRITNSLQRHLNAFNAGEDTDPETNIPHVHHILCNALFLAATTAEHPEMDDRYKP